MLKLNYTDSDLYLEKVSGSLETWLTQRVILALRSGQSIYAEPGTATFLLPADTPGLAQLEQALSLERSSTITVAPADAEFVEIVLQGTWVAADAEVHEGTFITPVRDRLEVLLYKLWQTAQAQVSFLV